jgi:hypothetical protein
MDNPESWRDLISRVVVRNNDSWEGAICTLTEEELDIQFDSGYGGVNGEPFTMWTNEYVYFPICYDGAEWCGSAPRNPTVEKLSHQGGG